MPTPALRVFERGWLSANNILFEDEGAATLVDTGYVTHAPQTLALVDHALQGRPLTRIINTHLHSDHCGGNAALQAQYPGVQTLIPPGESAAVENWDESMLSYKATAQTCPRFSFDAALIPGEALTLGGQQWRVLSAPGHDPHSIVLYCEQAATLISADALWENGFGLVFPELEGQRAFDAVGATLEVISRLNVSLVIPGHGAPFTDCTGAVARARKRLEWYVANPAKHAWNAIKSLLMYRMMAQQHANESELLAELARAPLFVQMTQRWFDGKTLERLTLACDELVARCQLRRMGSEILLA